MSKKIEQYLAEVDYNWENYTPSVEAIKFINFIKAVNYSKGGEEHNSPILHLRMLDNIFNDKKRIANMLFRGAAKTTVFAEYLFPYIAAFGKLDGFGKVSLAIYVSDSIENGVKNLRRNIEYRYNESEFLQEYIPRIRFTDTRLEFENKDGHILVVKMYGAKTGVRGTKELGKRPNLAVLDDLISDEDARSATIIASIEDTVHKAVSKALHPTKSKTIWNGTPFNAGDPLYKAIEAGEHIWNPNVYPVCEEFGDLTTKENFRSAWPDRFTYEYVKDEYEAAKAQGKLQGFYQELMLRVVSDEERIIDEADIVEYDYMLMKDSIADMNIYITTDFAVSDSKTSDYSGISVWGVNSNDDIIWLDGICSRQLMNKNIDQLFKFVQIYKPMSVGIEISGQQKGFISWIKDEMIRRKVYFNLESSNNSNKEGMRPIKDKLERMKQMQPRFKLKKMWFPHNHRVDVVNEIKNELLSITNDGIKSKHDDMIDTISMLSEMSLITPSTEMLQIYDPLTESWSESDYDFGGNSYIID